MSDMSDMTQIVRVMYEGIEIVLRIGVGGLKAAKKMVEFLIGMIDFEKHQGKTSMKKMLQKGGALEVFRFTESDFDKVKQYAKKYGVLYAELPDINKGDGMKEILFPADQVPRMNLLIQKLKLGEITSLEEYFKNSDDVEKMLAVFKQFKDPSAELDPIKNQEEFRGLVSQMDMAAKESDSRLAKINFDDAMIVKETQTKVLVGTAAYPGAYLWLDKADVLWDEGVEKHRVYIDKAADYELVSIDGQTIVKTISGSELSENGFEFSEQTDDIVKDIEFKAILSEDVSRIKISSSLDEGAYVWLDKEDLRWNMEQGNMRISLNPEKEYEVYKPSAKSNDKVEEQLIATVKGKDLFYCIGVAPGTVSVQEKEPERKTEASIRAEIAKNENLVDITLDKSIVIAETDSAYKTRVPKTWGDHVRYLMLDKKDTVEINDGKTLLGYIDKTKNYDLLDGDNDTIVETKSGEDLYSHYDKVDKSVREHSDKNVTSGHNVQKQAPQRRR